MANNDHNSSKDSTEANPMWGGQFNRGPAEIMQKINESISFDYRLYEQDIAGSIAHCTMLMKKKIIPSQDGEVIIQGLKQIQKEIYRGKFNFKKELEDIHMNIESRLHELVGDAAGKLHTARSRNDQVAVDFKLYIRKIFVAVDNSLAQLQKALVDKAADHTDTIMPGYTHLQPAQPVVFGHHLLAYVEMFGRDRSRIKDALLRSDECPLGAAALAGTSFPIDRKMTAKALGFNAPTNNSIDSVSDRDFVLDFLYCSSVIAMHLSRLAEELVLWTTQEFAFVGLSDSFTTGSSIMPQKRNPDAAELVRGKTGRVYGALITLLTTLKGLPLTYGKDMQEDKEPVFDVVETISLCLSATTGMINDMKVNTEAMRKATAKGYLTATDLADWLVQNLDLPFRKCHKIVARIVKVATEKQCELKDLSLSELQAIEPGITEAVFPVLNVDTAVHSRHSYGGTAPENVKRMVREAKKTYQL
jgi:argininosuccinate lyase